jgi:hypothetical protein
MSINIKPSHKGLLTKKIGKKGLSHLGSEEKKAKKSGNVKLEREIVFARNERNWDHKGRTGKRSRRVGA